MCKRFTSLSLFWAEISFSSWLAQPTFLFFPFSLEWATSLLFFSPYRGPVGQANTLLIVSHGRLTPHAACHPCRHAASSFPSPPFQHHQCRPDESQFDPQPSPHINASTENFLPENIRPPLACCPSPPSSFLARAHGCRPAANSSMLAKKLPPTIPSMHPRKDLGGEQRSRHHKNIAAGNIYPPNRLDVPINRHVYSSLSSPSSPRSQTPTKRAQFPLFLVLLQLRPPPQF